MCDEQFILKVVLHRCEYMFVYEQKCSAILIETDFLVLNYSFQWSIFRT